MSNAPRPHASNKQYATGRGTYVPRQPGGGAMGSAAGGAAAGGAIAGIAVPLLCLGCISTLALIGIFATMIAAAVYMNKIQSAIGNAISGNGGTTIEFNFMVLIGALFCSMYVLLKHRRGVAST